MCISMQQHRTAIIFGMTPNMPILQDPTSPNPHLVQALQKGTITIHQHWWYFTTLVKGIDKNHVIPEE